MDLQTYMTQNDLPEEIRNKASELLNRHLATLIDLKLQAKHAHWNVKGPHFVSLYELFDEVAAQAEASGDAIAERIAALGGSPEGTPKLVAVLSLLPEYPSGIAGGIQHVRAMAVALAVTGKSARAASHLAAAFHDADTSDLFTQISSQLDRLLWKLEAHLVARD
jgi:starvation-inducible DNA-binding protein